MQSWALTLAAVLLIASGCDGRRALTGADATVDAMVSRDARSPQRTSNNVAFVTSWGGSGNFGGLQTADDTCRRLASGAGLDGVYVSWLSSGTVNAADRLGSARGWVRPDGRPLADRIDDLLGGRLLYPISVDELGRDLGTYRPLVFTGTGSNGIAAPVSRCADWTTASSDMRGRVGRSGATFGDWSSTGEMTCNVGNRLYCFGIDRAEPLVMPPPTMGRLAFVTQSSWSPSGGLAGADGMCKGEASRAGLSGHFLALLATTTSSAASRFDRNGLPWIRRDGIQIAATTGALFSRPMEAPINVTVSGSYVGGLAWTGSHDFDQPGTASSTCADWQGLSSIQAVVDLVAETSRTAPPVPHACRDPLPLFCLER